MNTRTWWWIIGGLFVVIVIMTVVLFVIPTSPHPSVPTTATTTSGTTPATSTAPAEPLSAKVVVTSPQPKTHVGHTFTIAGVAPGGWFFEAQFPIQVRDSADNVVGRATGSAQGDWETENLVTFTATMNIDATFHGSADLVLMKDNPSGLPENDDSVEIPIIVD